MSAAATRASKRTRSILLWIWFGGFALALGALLFLYVRGWIHAASLRMGATQLNELYAPYLGAITLYYWGAKGTMTANGSSSGSRGAALALTLSGCWNVLLLAFLVPPVLGTGAIEDALENLSGVVGGFSWLAAGAIGYYFGSPKTARGE